MEKVKSPLKVLVKKVHQFDGHSSAIYTLEQGMEPHLFYSGSGDNIVIEWNLNTPDKSYAIAKLPVKAFSIKLIPEKQILLIGNYTGGIHVMDLRQKKEIKLLQFYTETIYDINYLPEKKCFFALSSESFSVWSSEDYSLIKVVTLSNLKLRSIEFNLSRNEAIIGVGDGSIRIIELDTFTEIGFRREHLSDFSVNTVKFNPKGTLLYTGSRDAHLNIWDVNNNYKLLDRIPAHNFAIYSIVFNKDGSFFATGSRDKTIRIWDSETGKPFLTINKEQNDGHHKSVNKLLWSKHNDILISTGDDRNIIAWEITRK